MPNATPVADSIVLCELDNRRVGNVLECGIFSATVTAITPILVGMRITSDLTYTPTTLPTNGSIVVCQDANQMDLQTHTINIQGEKRILSIYGNVVDFRFLMQ